MAGKDRAVVGLETSAVASLGWGLTAPGAGMGSWAVGRVGRASGVGRDIKARGHNQALTENTADILGQYLLS